MASGSVHPSPPLRTITPSLLVVLTLILSISLATAVPRPFSPLVEPVRYHARPTLPDSSLLRTATTNQSANLTDSKSHPVTSQESSIYYDAAKQRWIYAYTATAEFRRADGPDGYVSYNPEVDLPHGNNTKASSSLSYDKTKQLYVVYFSYSTELVNAP